MIARSNVQLLSAMSLLSLILTACGTSSVPEAPTGYTSIENSSPMELVVDGELETQAVRINPYCSVLAANPHKSTHVSTTVNTEGRTYCTDGRTRPFMKAGVKLYRRTGTFGSTFIDDGVKSSYNVVRVSAFANGSCINAEYYSYMEGYLTGLDRNNYAGQDTATATVTTCS